MSVYEKWLQICLWNFSTIFFVSGHGLPVSLQTVAAENDRLILRSSMMVSALKLKPECGAHVCISWSTSVIHPKEAQVESSGNTSSFCFMWIISQCPLTFRPTTYCEESLITKYLIFIVFSVFSRSVRAFNTTDQIIFLAWLLRSLVPYCKYGRSATAQFIASISRLNSDHTISEVVLSSVAPMPL